MVLAAVAVVLAGCAGSAGPLGRDDQGQPTEITNQAPPGATIAGNGTLGVLTDGTGIQTAAGHTVDYRGLAESPFADSDEATRAEIGLSAFETEKRLLFLNVRSCIAGTEVTPAHGWGLLDGEGELLNANYANVTVDWLEAPYAAPKAGDCAEGWIGVLVDWNSEPATVIWTDVWEDETHRWPIGQLVTPGDIEPLADDLVLVDLNVEAEGSRGSYWTASRVVEVIAAEADVDPPSGTSWWVVEASYCTAPGDDRQWDQLQLAVDGWYVFNGVGREIGTDPDHPVQPPLQPGGCSLVWETFALPLGLEPSHVRLSAESTTTVWRVSSPSAGP